MKSASQVLAAAFADYPFFSWVLPEENHRHRALPWFFETQVKVATMHGRVDVVPGAAAALWLPPNATISSVRTVVLSGMLTTPLHMGIAGTKRLLELEDETVASRTSLANPDAWYLLMVGVDPVHQGEGLAKKLLSARTAEADLKGRHLTLETSLPKNVGFYESLGFEVSGHHQPASIPEYWSFNRVPQPVRLEPTVIDLAPNRVIRLPETRVIDEPGPTTS